MGRIVILYTCTLPFPVSVNQLYGGGSGQQRFKTKKYNAWLKSCPELRELNIDEPVSVEYIFTLPDNRDRDITNYVKCAEDYLVSQKVLKDDNHKIVKKVLIRYEGVKKESPKVEVVIRHAISDIPHK